MLEFSKLASNRASALEFLCNKFQIERTISCPSCKPTKHYVTARGSLRCSGRKAGYGPFGEPVISHTMIDFARWLTLIRLFDPGMCQESWGRGRGKLSNCTGAFTLMRTPIVEHVPNR